MSLSYELALELKGAGFPQKWSDGISFFNAEGALVEPIRRTNKPINLMANGAKCPTLSELIAACGERFGIFELKNGVSVGGGVDGKPIERTKIWYAIFTSSNGEHFTETKSEDYSTAEIAVAKLWLALNKK